MPFLNTPHASEYLKKKHGITYTPGTLEVLRSMGRGPRYQKAANGRVFYCKEDLDSFVRQSLRAVETVQSKDLTV